MSEEEIIKYFKEVISWYRENTPDRVYALNNKDIEMIQGLLDLYNKEKEKNKELENADLTAVYIDGVYDGEKKWKDKIKEKIEELGNGTFDARIILQELLEERN